MVEVAAQQYAANFFVAAGNKDTKIDFATFLTCLTKYPEVAPWFTVMDALSSAFSEQRLSDQSSGSSRDLSSTSSRGAESSSGLQGKILPVDAQRSLELSSDTMKSLVFLRSLFTSVRMNDVLQVFMSHAVGEGHLDQRKFMVSIGEIFPANSISHEEAELLERLMLSCFNYFSTDGSLDANEFAAGVYILCDDDSHESLKLAFHLVCFCLPFGSCFGV